MFEQFTIEEVNLMCIFNTGRRDTLFMRLKMAMPDFEEPEMVEIAESVIKKLAKMSNEDFAALDLYPEY